MKVCPFCGRDYVDELGYCLEDGTPLTVSEKITEKKTEQFGEPTFVRPAQTVAASEPITPARSSNRLGVILVIGILLVGILVVLGAGLVGIWFYIANKNNIARTDNQTQGHDTNANSNGIANVSNSTVGVNSTPRQTLTPTANSLTTPTPSPSRSPSPADIKTNSNRSSTTPKTVSGGMLNARAISLPKPPYPPAARAVRASGTVSVQVLIDEEGNVVSATAVSGHPLLRPAAVAAARGAKFSPTLLSGQPVKVSGVINYNFVP